jgi:hypothetical protein
MLLEEVYAIEAGEDSFAAWRERERDKESMGIIELEAKTTPFLTVSSGPRRTEFFV